MTEDDARRHAQRMTDTWPAGPKGYVWRDLVAELVTSDAFRSEPVALVSAGSQ